MSGGHFYWNQSRIKEISEEIQNLIDKNGLEKTEEEIKEEGWKDPNWYKLYPEDKFHRKYSEEVLDQFKIAVDKLKEAYIYAQRIDWFVSGDDGEETFLIRLKNELDEKNKTKK
jgi:hypothetical protein